MSSIEFSRQIDQLSTLLHSFAYSLTRNSEDAKDLFQETALRAIKNKEKFNPGTNLKAWLFTIMRNIFINNYRRKSRSNTILDSTDNLHYINSGGPAIANEGDSNIMMKELTTMVKSLDDNLRIPFMMHYQGYKYNEIAAYLEVPLGTIKSRIFLARKALKKLVQERYEHLHQW